MFLVRLLIAELDEWRGRGVGHRGGLVPDRQHRRRAAGVRDKVGSGVLIAGLAGVGEGEVELVSIDAVEFTRARADERVAHGVRRVR